MKKEIADRWIEALRSGNYLQGRSQLRSCYAEDAYPERFCCLGVLCEISGLGAWDGASYQIEGIRKGGYLPDKVRDWAGMYTTDGQHRTLTLSLTTLNDNKRLDFNEIAYFIEKHWEAL